jgi:hypothetical protein
MMIPMAELVEGKFREWTRGADVVSARVTIFEKIRDIPYAVIPEINDAERYVDILRRGKGSCTPKHFLLCNMYQKLGLMVFYVVYPFRWDEIEIEFPRKLKRLAEAMSISYHIACKVDIGGELVLVDATLDPVLKELGLPVNMKWDGTSNTLLPIYPCGEEQLYHPSEAHLIQPRVDEDSLTFYGELNAWLEKVRTT